MSTCAKNVRRTPFKNSHPNRVGKRISGTEPAPRRILTAAFGHIGRDRGSACSGTFAGRFRSPPRYHARFPRTPSLRVPSDRAGGAIAGEPDASWWPHPLTGVRCALAYEVVAIETIGRLGGVAPSDPAQAAFETAKTPPTEPTRAIRCHSEQCPPRRGSVGLRPSNRGTAYRTRRPRRPMRRASTPCCPAGPARHENIRGAERLRIIERVHGACGVDDPIAATRRGASLNLELRRIRCRARARGCSGRRPKSREPERGFEPLTCSLRAHSEADDDEPERT